MSEPEFREKIFDVDIVDRQADEFRRYAEEAARLKKYGRVIVRVSSLPEATPHELPPGGSPWHQYHVYLGSLVKFFPHPKIEPYLPKRHVEKNRQCLLDKVKVLDELGLEASFRSVEPFFWPEAFFTEYPHLRGPRVDHPRRSTKEEFAPCTDLPEVLEMYQEMTAELKRNVPMLTSLSLHVNDAGSGFCWAEALYPGKRGPAHCQQVDPGLRVANFVETLHRGAQAGGGPIRIYITGNFYGNEVYTIVPKLSNNSFLAGWKSDALGVHGRAAYPVRGILQPLNIITALEKIDDPETSVFALSFADGYQRQIELFATQKLVIDIIEDCLKKPATKGLRGRLDKLYSFCQSWGGEKNADPLFEAFLAFDEAVKLKKAAYPRSVTSSYGVTLRYITRPLLIRPELLSPEEESYFLPHIFNIRQNEARRDYLDRHGGNTPINPLLRQAQEAFITSAKKFEALQDLPEEKWLRKLVPSDI